MRSPASFFERIPYMSFILSSLKHCKRKKALKTEPKSVWDCLGDITFRKRNTHTNKTPLQWLVLVCVSLFVNSKEAHNEKVFS